MDCEIVYTDILIFKNIIKENGHYALHIMKQISEQGLLIFDKLVTLSYKQLPGRVAGLLMFFSTEIFKSPIFEIPLSRQEMADIISTTKESISRTLTEFKNDKIIIINEKKIEIKSAEILNTLIRIG
jgi:CRP-like cAMP-binding protein